MTLIETPAVTGTSYRDVLRRANLHDAFQAAWDVPLDDHNREDADLENVSEDVLIERALAEADGFWTLHAEYSPTNAHVSYSITPFALDETPFSAVEDSLLRDIADTVETIRTNRPDDPEMVSYALDDLETQLAEIPTDDN